MMDNAVKERGGNPGIGEDVIPTSELKVCSDDKRLSFIALRKRILV